MRLSQVPRGKTRADPAVDIQQRRTARSRVYAPRYSVRETFALSARRYRNPREAARYAHAANDGLNASNPEFEPQPANKRSMRYGIVVNQCQYPVFVMRQCREVEGVFTVHGRYSGIGEKLLQRTRFLKCRGTGLFAVLFLEMIGRGGRREESEIRVRLQ